MKNVLTFLLLLAAVTSLHAQNGQKMFVWKNSTMKAMDIADVDSITFALDDNAIQFTTGDGYYVAENSFKAAFSLTSNLSISPSAKVEVGTCWSMKYKEPTINNYVEVYQREINDKQSWATSFNYLYSGTTYYYRPYVMVDSVIFYGNVKSVTTYGPIPLEVEDEDSIIMEVKHGDCVDLGLSVKWATCNLGASKPEEHGDYYSWGETTLKRDYDDYDEAHYKFKKPSSSGYHVTSYNKYNGTDKKVVLDSCDDAATVNLGEGWRMPTKEEIVELSNQCKVTTTTVNDTQGYLVTGPNGRTIFLPKVDFKNGSETYDYTRYWSSSVSNDCNRAVYLQTVKSGSVVGVGTDIDERYHGLVIRPVHK